MRTITIKVNDPIECSVSKYDADFIRPILSFPSVFYRPGMYRKERVEYNKSTMSKSKDGQTYFFYTGFLERVKKYCKEKGADYKILNEETNQETYQEPNLQGIIFREDQKRLIKNALLKQRGVLKSGTGTGKTLLAAGLISSINKKTLFMVHTLTLVNQTASEFKKVGLKNITTYTGEDKDLTGDIVVGTVQSFSKLFDTRIPSVIDSFKIVIVDESHHCGKMEGTYATVLKHLFCPIRIGFTATLPDKEEAKMALEGFLGPLIDEFSLEEGIEQGILAKPIIKIIKIPTNFRVKELRNYQDVYEQGITNNKIRNEKIIDSIIPYINEGKSVLILLTRIEHGENIKQIAEQKGLNPYFVRGSTESELRDEIKTALIEKNIKLVIATTIFKEGVNLPSLDVIVNAAGGKSEIATLQSIGRGLRTTKDKTEVILIDFFDNSHRYLIEHFGERLCLYMENNWL
jgi:superfamily II DNA or RNA helicase